MEKVYYFKGILQNEGWLQDAFVKVNDAGNIVSIASTIQDDDQALVESVDGYALPGFQNAHSHAFQYAMAGLAENHATNGLQDSFWSWREAMYQIALTLEPEDLEAIASMLYKEMLKHGYTHVAEFHYLHHESSGNAYRHLAEMGERLICAAKEVGIGLTLIPIFYQKGGFGQPPNPRQIRFISKNVDEYYKLLEASIKSASLYEDANVAYGLHSMRGVGTEEMKQVALDKPDDVPLHIHISEQLQEVDDCLAHLGQRPVQWLCQHLPVNENYHLVHATHLSQDELQMIVKSQANVVLCPSTEGNLGDGLFDVQTFINSGGSFSIGTDSHIGLNPLEELRWLDYGQRLVSHQRDTFQGDAALMALQRCTITGRKAMGHAEPRFFKEGFPLNALIIDAKTPLLACTSTQNLTATMLYTHPHFYGTLVKGRWVIKDNQHAQESTINQRFIQHIKKLQIRF